MVGIVVVSHSQKVAEGAKELALQMAADAKIAAAGGLQDGSIGTDMEKITNAINEVMSDDGVIMLVDMGSAIMTSEMAIEMSDNPDKIKIVDTPVVEGTIFGAVEASIGSSMEQIMDVLAQAKTQPKF
ncbi:dihydroxyacetone kinase phosphoryl donor subunit DhaM [Eubacterium sp. 1001713B170207_170306_E7]|uniref:dihydroxyacetone kinase phosphoryl donor subunit DhaM n=1 Tax=Eubacterium sp. 1001713B170207_170306_E7 TaxID=2787097 RepID=UPI0018993067|nr:dihydroxyacetone kinase phosphoryl donor subunit DhaM [Eubacterium sp. 1001713B170207_170306_E7]